MSDERQHRGGGFDLTIIAVLAAGLGAVVLLTWAAVLGAPPNDLAVAQSAPDTWVVVLVPIGGPAWSAGVRPGMQVIGIDPPTADPAGTWNSLFVTDGQIQISVPRQPMSPNGELAAAVGAIWILAVLAVRRTRNVAWLLALGSIALPVLSLATRFDPPTNGALLLAGPIASAIYEPRRRGATTRSAVLAGVVGLIVLVGWAGAYAERFDRWDLLAWASVGITACLAVFGVAGLALDAWRRARARQAATAGGTSPVLAMLADELVPGRTRTRLSAVERERTRLANELHTEVLPDLSSVIRDIEANASPGVTAARLRRISSELRDLMNERRVAALEELGLVPALEWLAETVQARTGVPVELEVAGDSRADPEVRPPREIEVAAFRIAQQALDNALVHGRPRSVHLAVAVHAGHVSIELNDDGTGIAADAESRALRTGHLGLADMRQTASAVGGALSVGPRPGGGTRVVLQWPA